MASLAAGDGSKPSPVHTLSAEERIIRSLNPHKKSFRRPPKFTNEPPPDVQLPSPRIKPNHSHTDPPSQTQPHANQPTTSTAAILSKLQQPSLTSNAVSEQKEMAITADINDHECCREIAKSPLHSLEDGEESFALDKLILTSPADENGNHPPPAPPPTSRNEPPFLRRSQRQTRSKYKSQTLAQQPPTSANTPPSSSLQQPSPTAILTPPTAISKLSSQANQPPASSPQPTQATHHSREHPAVTLDLVNGFSPQNNQPPASSPQPTQATHHSGDYPAVTTAIHHQNQPVLHGQLPQDSVQATTTSQPQSPPTQTTPTRQKTTCKSQASTQNSAHGQLQLSTKS
ncbi:extensin-like [Citrus sinensis]|uniref:extensin-like n=1 Tax=Citrus sinensis TaxID=2711 RepID=UPI00227977A4|nr:extensin-like [Citrus sinensis]